MNPGLLYSVFFCAILHWLSEVDFITIAGLGVSPGSSRHKTRQSDFSSFFFSPESSSLMVGSGSYLALEWGWGNGGGL